MGNRPELSDPIKRTVRQRCGFGCVMCGLPFYEYHHMVAFAVVREHTAENITLLCRQHHGEATNGLLPATTIRDKDNQPFNLTKGKSSPYLLHYGLTSCEFIVGGNTFENDTGIEYFDAIRIDGQTILGFRRENGNVLTTFVYYDENEREIVRILDNELQYFTDLWDVEFVGRRLKIRNETREIIADITFEPPNKVIINRAKMYCNGIGLLVTENGLRTLNEGSAIGISKCQVVNFRIGFGVGRTEVQHAFKVVVNDEQRHKYVGDEEIRRWIEWTKNPLSSHK